MGIQPGQMIHTIDRQIDREVAPVNDAEQVSCIAISATISVNVCLNEWMRGKF